MNVRRRNRLVAAFHTVLLCVPVAVIGWALWQTRLPGRPWQSAVGLGVLVVGWVGPVLWATVQGRRAEREMDRALRAAGVDPDAIPERPLPIVPRLRLAKDRDQLLAGILFAVLLVFVFVAYYAGWIGRWTGHPEEG